MSNARVDQLVREAYVSGPTNARVNQLVRETSVRDTVVNARVNQLVREAWVQLISGLVHIIGGRFQDLSSSPIANGTLVVKLSADGQQVSTNGQIAGQIKTTIPLDSTGSVSGTHYLWANSALIPTTSYYSFMLYTADGQPCWRKRLTATIPNQTTYDIGQLLQN